MKNFKISSSFAGISRSASIICAYLMYKEKKTFKQTLSEVRNIRSIK